jgi:hypothetical protein
MIGVRRSPMDRTATARPGAGARSLLLALSLASLSLLALASPVWAQQQDSARAGVSPADEPSPTPDLRPSRPGAPDASSRHPPIRPRSAFLYSLVMPGLGQAKLDRGYGGALFFSVEIVAFAMLRQAEIDLHYAQKHSHDSTLVVLTYAQDSSTGTLRRDSTGAPIPSTFGYARYDSARVAARKTHVEDWLAVLIFNHLIAGADAFVAAQLWDLPAHVHPMAARADNGRMLLGASVAW